MSPPFLLLNPHYVPLLGSCLVALKMQSLRRKPVSHSTHRPGFGSNRNISTVTTLLNVMSMYHDTLLARIVKSNPSYRPLIPSSLHTRFTRGWSDKNTIYRWSARALELIRFTQLVIEMCLQRSMSERLKWRAILLLEVTKYVLVCYILYSV